MDTKENGACVFLGKRGDDINSIYTYKYIFIQPDRRWWLVVVSRLYSIPNRTSERRTQHLSLINRVYTPLRLIYIPLKSVGRHLSLVVCRPPYSRPTEQVLYLFVWFFFSPIDIMILVILAGRVRPGNKYQSLYSPCSFFLYIIPKTYFGK